METANEYDLESVKEELADVMNYCIQMSQVLNMDIVEIINAKMWLKLSTLKNKLLYF